MKNKLSISHQKVLDRLQGEQLKNIKTNLISLIGKDNKKIIDVCCGTSNILNYKFKINDLIEANYLGIDYDENAIKIAKETNPGLSFISLDIHTEEFFSCVDKESTLICLSNSLFATGDLTVVTKWIRSLSKEGVQNFFVSVMPKEGALQFINNECHFEFIDSKKKWKVDYKLTEEKYEVFQRLKLNSGDEYFEENYSFVSLFLDEYIKLFNENGWRVTGWYDSCSLEEGNMNTSKCEVIFHLKNLISI